MDESSFSASRKKLKFKDNIHVPVDLSIQYRIVNFLQVFTAISGYVKCKTCDGKVQFAPIETRGLGFKICVNCEKCEQRKITASAVVDRAYEINRRFILAMKLLGVGAAGCAKFYGLMDMPPFLRQTSYDIILKNNFTTVKDVFGQFASFAVRQEMNENNGPINNHLTVSGDGTWKKRGFTSLYGVASLIGYHTGKILDIVVKSAFCKLCRAWETRKDSTEYEEWMVTHELLCTSNHSGSAGKMEVDATIEVFGRSETLLGVKYANYVGNGDSKTYSLICSAKKGMHWACTEKDGHTITKYEKNDERPGR